VGRRGSLAGSVLTLRPLGWTLRGRLADKGRDIVASATTLAPPREADLKKATLDAIAEAKMHVELRQAMDQVLAESKALAATSVATVQALITELKLVP